MTDHVERNQEWASLLRAELRGIWDGYDPKLFPTVHGEQVPPPKPAPAVFLRGASYLDDLETQRTAHRTAPASLATPDPDELERRIAARRAKIASPSTPRGA